MSTQQVQAVRLPRLLSGIPDQGHNLTVTMRHSAARR
jgi:hypothetical protein